MVKLYDNPQLRLYVSSKSGEVTPLYQAVVRDGADPNEPDDYGLTPMYHAAGLSDPTPLRLLLAHGGHHTPEWASQLPLGNAVIHGCVANVAALLFAGADPKATTNGDPVPALQRAIAKYRSDVVSLLLDAGADACQPDGDGSHALHTLAAFDLSEPSHAHAEAKKILRTLLYHPASTADLHAGNGDGLKPSEIAAACGNHLLVTLMDDFAGKEGCNLSGVPGFALPWAPAANDVGVYGT